MDLTFREYLEEDKLIESFELTDKYKRLSKSEADKYWLKFHDIEDEELLGLFYQDNPMMKCYIVKNEGLEYFIFSFVKNTIFEIHFYDTRNMGDDDSLDKTGVTKNSQAVFSAILSIVLAELEERPTRKIKIGAPEGRETFYKKIIDKTLKKYNIEKTISLTKSTDGKYVIHNFLLEKEQNKIFIGIE